MGETTRGPQVLAHVSIQGNPSGGDHVVTREDMAYGDLDHDFTLEL